MAACLDAFKSVGSETTERRDDVYSPDINTVYLPGPDRRIMYNNRTDVLHLQIASKDYTGESANENGTELNDLDNLAGRTSQESHYPIPEVPDLLEDSASDISCILQNT